MSRKDILNTAIKVWCEGASHGNTDLPINDLLEDIAGSKYLMAEVSDDPIIDTFHNLTNAELRRYIKEGNMILYRNGLEVVK